LCGIVDYVILINSIFR